MRAFPHAITLGRQKPVVRGGGRASKTFLHAIHKQPVPLFPRQQPQYRAHSAAERHASGAAAPTRRRWWRRVARRRAANERAAMHCRACGRCDHHMVSGRVQIYHSANDRIYRPDSVLSYIPSVHRADRRADVNLRCDRSEQHLSRRRNRTVQRASPRSMVYDETEVHKTITECTYWSYERRYSASALQPGRTSRDAREGIQASHRAAEAAKHAVPTLNSPRCKRG